MYECRRTIFQFSCVYVFSVIRTDRGIVQRAFLLCFPLLVLPLWDQSFFGGRWWLCVGDGMGCVYEKLYLSSLPIGACICRINAVYRPPPTSATLLAPVSPF